jgi:hypothetical protein
MQNNTRPCFHLRFCLRPAPLVHPSPCRPYALPRRCARVRLSLCNGNAYSAVNRPLVLPLNCVLFLAKACCPSFDRIPTLCVFPESETHNHSDRQLWPGFPLFTKLLFGIYTLIPLSLPFSRPPNATTAKSDFAYPTTSRTADKAQAMGC